jgi:hypothetical protein
MFLCLVCGDSRCDGFCPEYGPVPEIDPGEYLDDLMDAVEDTPCLDQDMNIAHYDREWE